MFGERVTGIFAVVTECTDPAQEQRFNEWYTNVRMVDMVDGGPFFRASRFKAATPGAPTYLVIYETNEPLERVMADHVERRRKELVEREGDARPPMRLVHGLWLETLQPGMFTFAPLRHGMVTGLLLMASNPKTPGTDEAFNRWYDRVHMKDIAAAQLHRVGHRFKTLNVGPEDIRYVNLYETDMPDVPKALTGLDAFRQGWIDGGTYYADREFKLRAAYRWLVSYAQG